MFSSFIRVVAYIRISFLFKAEWHSIVFIHTDHILFIHKEDIYVWTFHFFQFSCKQYSLLHKTAIHWYIQQRFIATYKNHSIVKGIKITTWGTSPVVKTPQQVPSLVGETEILHAMWPKKRKRYYFKIVFCIPQIDLQSQCNLYQRGSAGEYQADERAGVARLSWRVSGRWEGRCRAAQLAIIRQMSGQVSRSSAAEYHTKENELFRRLVWKTFIYWCSHNVIRLIFLNTT